MQRPGKHCAEFDGRRDQLAGVFTAPVGVELGQLSDRLVVESSQGCALVGAHNSRSGVNQAGGHQSRYDVVLLTDDLDGTDIPAGKARPSLGLDGTSYEIDLTAKNAGALRKALEPYIDGGRPIKGSRRQAVRTRIGADTRTIKEGVGPRQRLQGQRPWPDP